MITIRLLDARRGLHRKCEELFGDTKIAEAIYRFLCDGIEECEDADVVEVVRCEDCKNWNRAECHSTIVPNVRRCMVMNVFTDPDQYCKYGERRTDDAEIH